LRPVRHSATYIFYSHSNKNFVGRVDPEGFFVSSENNLQSWPAAEISQVLVWSGEEPAYKGSDNAGDEI